MKYKLKDKQKEFLETLVKPDSLSRIIKGIELCARAEAEERYNALVRDWGVTFSLVKKDLLISKMHCVTLDFTQDDFDEIIELKPYVWYPASRFDGNPNRYMLVEAECGNPNFTMGTTVCSNMYEDYDCLHRLMNGTTHFMYLEHPTKENTK